MNKEQATEFLKKASKAYYEGNPIISDEEFDALSTIVEFDLVGSTSTDKIKHPFRLYSLQKVFVGEGNTPSEMLGKDVVWTPKLDGAAISIIIDKGKVVLALKRGDGIEGDDITEKAKLLLGGAELTLSEMYQITGEVVAPKTVPNSRNYAAGSLNLKSLEEFKQRTDLKFIAYGLQPFLNETWAQDMFLLHSMGISTVMDSDWFQYPQDGNVARLDNYDSFEEAGYTAKHPKGAFALKKQKEGIETTLLDVIWQTGKSGVVTPVAILEPVNIDGAMVSRATLHNIGYIRLLNLEIGCKVLVIRSGEIIPRIIARVD